MPNTTTLDAPAEQIVRDIADRIAAAIAQGLIDAVHRAAEDVVAKSEPTIEERFWARLAKGGPDECWLWHGPVDRSGYGIFTAHGQQTAAHRFAWATANCAIPEGMIVRHSCENRACQNPDHLYVVFRKLALPAIARRAARIRSGRIVLTTDEMRHICLSAQSDEKLAAHYGVDAAMIASVRSDRRSFDS